MDRRTLSLTLELFSLLKWIASVPKGRDYLSTHPRIVDILFAALSVTTEWEASEIESEDAEIRNDMQETLLECLEHLSTNEVCLNAIFNVAILPWLVENLPNLLAFQKALALLNKLLQTERDVNVDSNMRETLLEFCHQKRDLENKVRRFKRSILTHIWIRNTSRNWKRC